MHYFRASWYGGGPHLDRDNPPSKLLGNADHRTSQMGQSCDALKAAEVRTPAERHAARACPALSGMTWAQRLKRVFSIDIEVCARCGGSAKGIACIEDQDVIDRILNHLRQKEQETPTRPLLVPPTRAPPGTLPLFAGKDSRPTTPH